MKIQNRYISKLDAGKFRDLVILIPPTDTQNGREVARVYNEADGHVQYGFVDPGGGTRQLQEAGLTYDNVITVYVRYNSVLNNNWQLRYNGSSYTIHKASDVDARKRFIQLLCYTKA